MNLTQAEIELALTALRYTAEYGYTYEMQTGESLEEYHAMQALIKKLED